MQLTLMQEEHAISHIQCYAQDAIQVWHAATWCRRGVEEAAIHCILLHGMHRIRESVWE